MLLSAVSCFFKRHLKLVDDVQNVGYHWSGGRMSRYRSFWNRRYKVLKIASSLLQCTALCLQSSGRK